MKHLRAISRIIGFFGLTIGFVALQCILGRFRATCEFLPHQYSKAMIRVMGIRAVFNPASAPLKTGGGVMIVANHISELDPVVMSANFKATIVAGGWLRALPVAGAIMAMTRPVFVRRHHDHNPHNRAKVNTVLNEGRNIVMFPEAVTSDASMVYEFKTGILKTLFGESAVRNGGKTVALTREVAVQPVAIRIKSVNGKNADDHKNLRLLYTLNTEYVGASVPWKRKISLLWNTLCNSGIVLEMTVLPALEPKKFADARALADAAELSIRKIVAPHQMQKIKRAPVLTAGESRASA